MFFLPTVQCGDVGKGSHIQSFNIEQIMTDFGYDVAISFCYEDEDLALALRDALEGINVFVFSKAQEELAGTDGMQAFIDTFRERSRTIVVLHRDKWGTTKWTKVEETAIKDFCLDGGWPGLFVVSTAESTRLPKWVPKTHLYFDLAEFPFDQLVGAIKARAKERGSEIVPEAVSARGKRMAERHEFEKETTAMMRREEGITGGTKAVSDMLEKISEEVASIGETSLEIGCEGEASHFVVRAGKVSLVMNWQHYANTIADCPLNFRIFVGPVPLPSERGHFMAFEDPIEKESFSLVVDRSRAYGWCLRENADATALGSNEAAQFVLNRFLDAYDRLKDAELPW